MRTKGSSMALSSTDGRNPLNPHVSLTFSLRIAELCLGAVSHHSEDHADVRRERQDWKPDPNGRGALARSGSADVAEDLGHENLIHARAQAPILGDVAPLPMPRSRRPRDACADLLRDDIGGHASVPSHESARQ